MVAREGQERKRNLLLSNHVEIVVGKTLVDVPRRVRLLNAGMECNASPETSETTCYCKLC